MGRILYYAKKRKRLAHKIFLISALFSIACLTQYIYLKVAGFFPLHKSFFDNTFQTVLVLSVFAFLFHPIDRLVQSFSRRLLMRRISHFNQEMECLLEEIENNHLTLKEAGNFIVNTLSDVLGATAVSLLALDRHTNFYRELSSCGLNFTQISKLRFSDEHLLVRLAKQEERILVRDEISLHLSWQEANAIANEYHQLQAVAVIPFVYHNELIALCSLSQKAKARSYTKEDIAILNHFVKRMGRALGPLLSLDELEVINKELKNRQASLLQASKMAAIEQLATGFAHQIHNPLTIISGKAQVLLLRKDRNGLSDEVVQVLSSIVKETRRAADITHKLVAFSRPRKQAIEKIDFEQIVSDALFLLSYQTSLEHIRVERRIEPGLPEFKATVAECREMLLNLLANAVDAMQDGGVLTIEIRNLTAQSEIEIKVGDTGKGIPKEEIPKLFDPFFSTRHDRSGLGLFLVQRIVFRYGGNIRVDSAEHRGTVFTIRLPVDLSVESKKSQAPLVDEMTRETGRTNEVPHYAKATGS